MPSLYAIRNEERSLAKIMNDFCGNPVGRNKRGKTLKILNLAPRRILPLVFVLLVSAQLDAQEKFFYSHKAGDRYRIISTVTQDVFIDRVLSHSAEILNRIAVEVVSENNGIGRHRATFQTSERAEAAGGRTFGRPESSIHSFQWSREYESEFDRDARGRMTVAARYFMPVVRNVPVFPEGALNPGDKWTYDGSEVHDFRDNFGITEPYVIPFTANYEFLGEREWKGRLLPAFSVDYGISFEPAPVRGRTWPRRILGDSTQIVFWDTELGQPVAYHEEFRYVFELSNGRTIEYRGEAEAELVESERLDRESAIREIADDIERLGLSDISIREDPEGITITMEDIQFQAETAVMLPGEEAKIDRIAELLLRFPDRDILVGGHTALAGTADGRLRLSTERAAVIADRLISRNVRTADRVVVRGYGALKPVADNDTEEGMRRNRRVEITILEN